ncbi:MAG: response regulator [Planctomycetes bacterium]|nr:response regulator [Planctomycetota bacterium]
MVARTPARVLLVDEDPRSSEEISISLMGNGIHVHWAPNASTALRLLDEFHFDVALVEVQLPECSGIDLIRQLARRAPSILPILLATRPCVESAVAAVRVGAFDYLVKPIDDVRLAQVVSEAVRARHVLDAHAAFESRRAASARTEDPRSVGAVATS